MKKLVLTSVCALAMTGAAFAQGTIQWIPGSTSLVVQTNAVSYSGFFGGGAASGPNTGTQGNVPLWNTAPYYYMLLDQAQPGGSGSGTASATPTTLSALFTWSPAWNDSTVYATNSNALVNGRPTMTPANDNGQTVNWANGVTNSVMLVGWSGNLGTSWLAVSNSLATWNNTIPNAFFGVSSIGYINPGTANPGQIIFGTPIAASYGQLILNNSAAPMLLNLLPTTPVPEPGTLALAGLGGLSLLLFRRRK